jgi:ABC-type nitrate/sulfonate/bicarbonate transport system substrate-binding protein
MNNARRKKTMKRRKTAVWMAAALSVAMLGCSGQEADTADTDPGVRTEAPGDEVSETGSETAKDTAPETGSGADKAQLEDVTVILDYVANTNHTGMYVALDQGYYEEAGLNVRIIEPTQGATATLIAVGKGDFGISYQEDVTVALTSEEPLPIKAIAAIIQHNTSGFATYKDKNINSPKDFEGKTYAGWGGPGEEAVLKAVMTQAGGDFSKLTVVISDGSGFEALRDKADVMWFFEAWDNVKCQLNDFPIQYTPVRDLDERLDYYTPVIIASDKTLEERPDMVRKFLAATEKGYRCAMEDPEGSAKILQKYAPDYSLEMLTMSQEYLASKYMEDSDRWGVMKDEVWDGYTGFMAEYGVIKEAIPAAKCYTNEFLP